MQQLTFELAGPPVQTFATFRPGRNAEVVAAVRRLASGSERAQVCYLWGADGAGKTHLLRAAACSARDAGRSATLVDLRAPHEAAWSEEAWSGDTMRGIENGLLLIDHVDEASAAGQGQAFTAFNRVRDAGGNVLAAGRPPARRLAVRDDLRTRLAWGLSLEVGVLDDVEKRAALDEAAAGRGLKLPPEVGNYLLRHGPRDLPSLLQALVEIDRLSLANRRAITVHLVRDWLRGSGGSDAAGDRSTPDRITPDRNTPTSDSAPS